MDMVLGFCKNMPLSLQVHGFRNVGVAKLPTMRESLLGNNTGKQKLLHGRTIYLYYMELFKVLQVRNSEVYIVHNLETFNEPI